MLPRPLCMLLGCMRAEPGNCCSAGMRACKQRLLLAAARGETRIIAIAGWTTYLHVQAAVDWGVTWQLGYGKQQQGSLVQLAVVAQQQPTA
jgi:hypothetical protein